MPGSRSRLGWGADLPKMRSSIFLPDDDLADPRSSISVTPTPTPKSALNLSWPKTVHFAHHVEIEGLNELLQQSPWKLVGETEPRTHQAQESSGTSGHADLTPQLHKSSRSLLSSKFTLSLKSLFSSRSLRSSKPLPSSNPLPPPDKSPFPDRSKSLIKGDFIYNRLKISESNDIKEQTFRLLRISPWNQEGPVHGYLEQFIINEAPSYDALSYTWSSEYEEFEPRGRPLFIGKYFQRLAVTKNCEAALKQLRTMGKEYVWIDAICINQNDTDEKSSQIGLMHQIYAYATDVMVYLGPQEETRALHAFKQNPKGLEKYLSLDTYIEDLSRFFSKSYFSRIWVI